jgi:NADH dehydrogenase
MSSLGAARSGPSHYLRSKGLAEEVIRREARGLQFVIFRPSVIFGRGDSFINRFARITRLLPYFFPLARAQARLAPVYVGDVVEAFARGVSSEEVVGQALELCGPQVFTLRQIIEVTASSLGLRRRVIPLPDFVGWLQGFVLGLVPGKPFSLDNFRSLGVDSVCAQDGFEPLGIQPHTMLGIVHQYLGQTSTAGQLDTYRHLARR